MKETDIVLVVSSCYKNGMLRIPFRLRFPSVAFCCMEKKWELFLSTFVYTYVCIHVCTHVFMHACTYVCVYAVCMHVCMHICMEDTYMIIPTLKYLAKAI